MSKTCTSEVAEPMFPSGASLSTSTYIATAPEARETWRQNRVNRWYKEGVNPDDPTGECAFQRLRQTWFTPKIQPKFKLQADDKFYAIGSCFARGLENALIGRQMAVESAAPEFVALQPVKKETTGLGFTNKYNTFSILNELRWALDPEAVFPVESIARVTDTTWFDPHVTSVLELADFEDTLKRRELMRTVTRRIINCRAVIITLGLVEVWRDLQANVYLNYTPPLDLLKAQPERYEFRLTSFTENWATLESIYSLLSCYGHPDLRVVVTVSPVPLMTTFSTLDVIIANTYGKSLLRTAAQEWAAAHDNVDYFPSYEIVQNSDRAVVWQRDLRHVRGPGTQHIMDLFLRSYLA